MHWKTLQLETFDILRKEYLKLDGQRIGLENRRENIDRQALLDFTHGDGLVGGRRTHIQQRDITRITAILRNLTYHMGLIELEVAHRGKSHLLLCGETPAVDDPPDAVVHELELSTR
jgi:hypothetical protein